MRANEEKSFAPLRHGAYVCASPGEDVAALARRLGFENEFDAHGDPQRSIAYLKKVEATRGQVADDALLGADIVVHVAAPEAAPVDEFCAAFRSARILRGAVRPMVYTGNGMHDFAYAHRVLQEPGGVMPNAFLVPMNKKPEWWQKDFLERHSYFLPRLDDRGERVNDGHVLAAAQGIPSLLRRTYKSLEEPAREGTYHFVSYFECADADVPTFFDVMAALRDLARNPEWRFVEEGPTWRGRRVSRWENL